MAINGKCRREYNLTLDGEAFDLITNSLAWAKYYKEDTIKSVEKDRKTSMSKVTSKHDHENVKRSFDATAKKHADDIKKLEDLQKELSGLK